MTNTLLNIINSVMHIIESILSQEELPDFYEDNLETIAQVLSFILDLDYPNQAKVPEELIKCRAKVVRLVHIYTFKFGEHFSKYNEYFFTKIWQMITSGKVPPTKQNEKLIQSIVRYLNEMALNPAN